MADTKISALSLAASLTGTEVVPIVQGGDNKKTTTQDIADLAGGSVTSTELSQAISALSQAISVGDRLLSNVISQETSVARAAEASLSVLVGGLGGGSVTSTELSQAISVLSQAISVGDRLLSNVISQEASVARAAEGSLSTAVNVVSTAISQETSVARAAEASLSTVVAGLGAASVTSTELSQAVSVLSQAISVGDRLLSNLISQEASVARAAENSLSAAVNVVSNAVSQETSVARAAEVSLSNVISNRVGSVLSKEISQLSSQTSTLSTAVSQEISVRGAADSSLSVAINVVSNALSQEISVARAAEASLSQVVSAGVAAASDYASQASQYASIASQMASVVSAYASVVSAYASVVSAQTQGLQSFRIAGADANTSVGQNLTSLNISVAANGIYKIEWDLMISHAVSSTVSIALSGPALTNMAVFGRMAGSVGALAGASIIQGALASTTWGTILQTTLNAAGVNACQVSGVFFVGGAGGNIVISPGVATGSIVSTKQGSMVRAWKVG